MKITFEDKVTPQVTNDNKITSSDINHIKYVINTNDAYFETIRSYSTEEQIIGKWIDGKTLYRKVVTGVGVSTTDELKTTISNISQLITARGIVKSAYGQWWNIPNYSKENGYNMHMYVETPSGQVKISGGSYYNSNSPYILILEYTKK